MLLTRKCLPDRQHWSFDWDVWELDFSDKHGRRLHKRKERIVKERIIIRWIPVGQLTEQIDEHFIKFM